MTDTRERKRGREEVRERETEKNIDWLTPACTLTGD